MRYKTHVKPTPQMKVAEVVEAAKRAKARGHILPCLALVGCSMRVWVGRRLHGPPLDGWVDD